jgi:hypothetical protein
MTAATRLLVCLVVLSAGLAGIASDGPTWLAFLGVRGHQQGNSAAASQQQASRRLDEQRMVVAQRLKAKERITRSLLEREMTLFEAAAWFGYLNDTPPDCPDRHWKTYRGGCAGEKLCRQVMAWVAGYARQKMVPSQAEARMQELEQDLQCHIAGHGQVQLPSL